MANIRERANRLPFSRNRTHLCVIINQDKFNWFIASSKVVKGKLNLLIGFPVDDDIKI